MGEFEWIDQVAPESNVAHDRRVRRKDEDLSALLSEGLSVGKKKGGNKK